MTLTPIAGAVRLSPRHAGRAENSTSLGRLLAGGSTATVGAAGMAGGVIAMSSGIGPVRVAWLLPLSGAEFAAGATSGLFMVLTGFVAVAAGIYSVGYFAADQPSPWSLAVLPMFVVSMLAVPMAGSVATFMFVWELMAVLSLLAVLTEHHHEATREAARWYAALTQIGAMAILSALMILAAAGHSGRFSTLAAVSHAMSPATRDAVFVLSAIGFGSKAGLVPLHVWLPRAHPEAPSPVSALMSAAMVALGAYGLLRIDIQVLGVGARWWAVTLMAAGGVSAIYGVLQASVATDLKRLLAYSTTENMGLVALALGAGMLLSDYGQGALAALAISAAALHVLAHGAFKTLTFLAAGSVLHSTGLRDLDRLGGLASRMPVSTFLFGVGALGATGLPLGAGFASEWLLLQSLIHSRPGGGAVLGLVMPLAVGAVALTTGLGIAAMVKAFGVGFLARPRSAEADNAGESPRSMLVGMAVAAAGCGVMGVAPAVAGSGIRRLLQECPPLAGAALPSFGVVLRLPGAAGSVSPLVLAAAAAVAVLAVTVVIWLSGRRRPRGRTAPLWACGGGAPSARMQYTATSFAEPLQRVFDDVLRPDIDIEVSHLDESRYLLARVRYRSVLSDAVEAHLYTPILRAVTVWARWMRRAHNGRLQVYLAYGAAGLVVVLAVVR